MIDERFGGDSFLLGVCGNAVAIGFMPLFDPATTDYEPSGDTVGMRDAALWLSEWVDPMQIAAVVLRDTIDGPVQVMPHRWHPMRVIRGKRAAK